MSKFPSLSSDSTTASDSYVKLLISDSNSNSDKDEDAVNSVLKRLFSAVFYGVSSFLIIVVNKILLTSYK